MKNNCLTGEKLSINCLSCFLENACQNCPFTMEWTMGKVWHEKKKEADLVKRLVDEHRKSVKFGSSAIPV